MICLIETTIVPLKSVVGVIDSELVEIALGPKAFVEEYPTEVTPPNVTVNVPAVLPVTVKAIL